MLGTATFEMFAYLVAEKAVGDKQISRRQAVNAEAETMSLFVTAITIRLLGMLQSSCNILQRLLVGYS